MNASLAILNVGAGDVSVVFNPEDPNDKQRAIDMLTDMLKRGYAIMVQLEDGSYTRVHQIDADRSRYIVGAWTQTVTPEDVEAEVIRSPRRRGRPPKTRSVPMGGTTTTAIARSAGG